MQADNSAPRPVAPVTYLPSMAQPGDWEQIMQDNEFRFTRRVAMVYRVVFLIASIVMLVLSAHLGTHFDWVPSILAIGVCLVSFRWFLMSFVDERFEP